MTEYRAQFDATVTFGNGGGLSAREFRLDVPSAEVTEAEAGRLTETYRNFLEVIGDGVALTAAGYLPPAAVEQIAERTGITDWWIGKANREDLTYPVADIRTTARALGLVSVRKGRLCPTAAAIRCQDPQALWRHSSAGTPLPTTARAIQPAWRSASLVPSGSRPTMCR
jgi:hypothetical protein